VEPISNYGAMKLASEAQIRAAVESYLDRANILRFPNVVGTPATHGVILDFVHKLQATPHVLDVLGDGTQQKIYLHVEDLVEAMLCVAERASGPIQTSSTLAQTTTASRCVRLPRQCETKFHRASIRFGKGNRGWVGDVPRFVMTCVRSSGLGWTPAMDPGWP